MRQQRSQAPSARSEQRAAELEPGYVYALKADLGDRVSRTVEIALK